MSVGNIEDIVGNGAGDGASAAFDPTSGSLKVTEQEQPRFDDLSNPTFIAEDDLSVAVHYFPDANGTSQLGYKSLSVGGFIRSGTAGETITFTIEIWNGVTWIDGKGPFTDESGISPITTTPSATNQTVSVFWSWDHFPYQKWRGRVEVTGTASDNEAKIGSNQKAL